MKKRHSNQGLRKVCGCPRRTWAKCRHAWHFNFKMPHAGTSYRFSLDTHLGRHVDSKTEAEHFAAELRTALRAGRFGQPPARHVMTLRQLADTYLDRYVTVEHPDTREDFRSGLCVICDTPLPRPTGVAAPFGEWCLADIVTDTVERYREARRARGTYRRHEPEPVTPACALQLGDARGLCRSHALQAGHRARRQALARDPTQSAA